MKACNGLAGRMWRIVFCGAVGLTIVYTFTCGFFSVSKQIMKGTGVEEKGWGVWNFSRGSTGRVQGQPSFLHWKTLQEYIDRYHIAITSCGTVPWRLEEAFVALKSTLLLATHHRLHFHIFATPESHKYLEEKLIGLPNDVKKKFQYIFYEPYFPSGEWRDMFAKCSTQRLFIAEKIEHVRRLLYMDTDSMLVAPLEDVWREFDHFTADQMVAMAYNQIFNRGWYDTHPIPHLPPHGYNAGILLMDLGKIRTQNWVANLTRIMWTQKEEKSNFLGDQDILNEYFYYFPEKLRTMQCTLNFRKDFCVNFKQVDTNTTAPQACLDAERFGVVLIHASRKLAHNHRPNIFSLVYDAIESYNFSDIRTGFLEPLLRKIDATNKVNFSKSDCFHSHHLFYRNILQMVVSKNDTGAVTQQELVRRLRHELKLSDLIGLKPDVEYYLQRTDQQYDPMTRNRSWPESALMPLADRRV